MVTVNYYIRDFYVLVGDDDQEGVLHVALTDEGIIADLFVSDELVGTWARTAQELTEEL